MSDYLIKHLKSCLDNSTDLGGPSECSPDEPDWSQDEIHSSLAVSAWVRHHTLHCEISRWQERRTYWNCIQQVDSDGRQHRWRHQNLAVQQHEAVECQLGDQDGHCRVCRWGPVVLHLYWSRLQGGPWIHWWLHISLNSCERPKWKFRWGDVLQTHQWLGVNKKTV